MLVNVSFAGGFYLFWSWQVAFHWLRYKTIQGMLSPFEREGPQLYYECQIVGYPARVILDCDAYVEEFGGRLTMEEVQGIVEKVPVYLVTRLCEMGAIRREDVVVVMEKDKSRGNKASRHFVFNIIGVPTGDIKNVLHQVVFWLSSCFFQACLESDSRRSLSPRLSGRGTSTTGGGESTARGPGDARPRGITWM